MWKGCVAVWFVWWSFRVTRSEPVWAPRQRTLGSLGWSGQCIDSSRFSKKLQRRPDLM